MINDNYKDYRLSVKDNYFIRSHLSKVSNLESAIKNFDDFLIEKIKERIDPRLLFLAKGATRILNCPNLISITILADSEKATYTIINNNFLPVSSDKMIIKLDSTKDIDKYRELLKNIEGCHKEDEFNWFEFLGDAARELSSDDIHTLVKFMGLSEEDVFAAGEPNEGLIVDKLINLKKILNDIGEA